jgi:hypothetical protein
VLKEKLSNEEGNNAVYYGKKGLQDLLFDIIKKNTAKEIEDRQFKEDTMKKNVTMALMKFFKE